MTAPDATGPTGRIPDTMRAIAMTAFGGPDHLEEATLPVPRPGPGDVLIAVRTVAANRQDTFTMRAWAGRGPQSLPHVLGIDPAGVVAALGGDVDEFELGGRVVVKPSISCGTCRFCTSGEDDACANLRNVGVHRWGGMAEYVAVPRRNVFRIPESVSFAEATAISHSFPVALTMIRDRAGVTADDVVLVTGAAGAVASAAVQLARLNGARVIAAAGGPDRVARARELGAEDVIDYRAVPEFASEVRRLAPDGVTLYVETAGDPAIWAEALKALGRRARVTVCGSHGGQIVELDLNWLFRTRVSILGCSGSSLAAYRDVMELAGAGRIRANIHEVLPLARARDAFATLLGRGNRGKIILEVSAG
jgi:NADPH:quinone reductase-like Zn-dependent oxidoreductase